MSNFFVLEAGAAAGGGVVSIIYLVVLFGFMWFVLIRPQRKRQKQTEQMQYSIKIGDSVLTNGGLYGKVVDLVNDVVIVEFGTNKSVRVPIVRSAIASISAPNMSVAKEEATKEEVKEIEIKEEAK